MSLYDDILVGFGNGFGNMVGKLFSMKPIDGTADFDALRTGVATFTNKDKLIEVAPADLPRGDFSDFDCNTLLLEPATSNLALWSEDFTNAVWTTTLATITPNVVDAPDGLQTGDKLSEDSTNGIHLSQQSLAFGTGDISFSCFFKSAERSKIQIDVTDLATGDAIVNFDLNNISIISSIAGGSWTNLIGKIEDVGNGWRRCTVSANKGGGASLVAKFQLLDDDGNKSYQGDGSSGLYEWGAQFELLSYSTTYIPTTTIAVSRGADSLLGEVDAKNFSSEKGILFAHIGALADDLSSRKITVNNSSTAYQMSIGYNTPSNTIRGLIFVNNVSQANFLIEVNSILDFNKVAITWKPNDFAMYINGFKVGTDTAGDVPAFGVLNSIRFDQGASGSDFYGKTREVWHSGNTDFNILEYTAFADFDELSTNFKYDIQ